MIAQDHFTVEPWALRERRLDLGMLAQSESLFALSNGHLGMRGTLDEGEPFGLQGTYLNGFHERRPLPYAETAYGDPEDGQTVVNATDGKPLRLLVDDELLDVRYGRLHEHERVLDFRAGLLQRELRWESPTGKTVRVRSHRLVSLAHRGVAAIRYEVEAVDPVRLVVQSELVADEPSGGEAGGALDPRVAAALRAPLVSEQHGHDDTRALLIHRTRASGLRMAVAMEHQIQAPAGWTFSSDAVPDLARVAIAADLAAGERLVVQKLLCYAWSGQRSLPSVRAQVGAGLAEAGHLGWSGLCDAQRATLDAFWARADVEIEGDDELQQAVRFALFHVFQAAERAERRAIPAKGLTGSGYDGHAFWDSETFVLHLLSYTSPDAVADALRWRYDTLDLARERARTLGHRGAAFPWRTIAGQECSGYWPAGTAAFHVNADIADAVVRYVAATGDDAFEREHGVALLVETARLWVSLGHPDADGRFHIAGVTGPDEYSALGDDNVFTNLMAAGNLVAAADAVGRHPARAAELAVSAGEADRWRDLAAAVVVPWDERLGVHEQAAQYTGHDRWNFEATRPEDYPLLLHFPYFDLYRKQVVKQADLVLALHLRGDRFTPEEKARDFAYYESLTVRDSSLSACTQAVIAAEVGHLDLALAYVGEAALMDLRNLNHNTRDGLHVASLAGAWLGVVAGFGGLRDHGGRLTFAPRLPRALERVRFRLVFRGRRLRVEVDDSSATYELLDGEPLEVRHHGEALELRPGEPLRRTVPPIDPGPEPSQPSHRAPARRGAR